IKHNLVVAYHGRAPNLAAPLAAEILDELRAGADLQALGDVLYAGAFALRFMGREDEVLALCAELDDGAARAPPGRLTLSAHQLRAMNLGMAGDYERQRTELWAGIRLADQLGATGWGGMLRVDLLRDPALDIDASIADARALLKSLRPHHMF